MVISMDFSVTTNNLMTHVEYSIKTLTTILEAAGHECLHMTCATYIVKRDTIDRATCNGGVSCTATVQMS